MKDHRQRRSFVKKRDKSIDLNVLSLKRFFFWVVFLTLSYNMKLVIELTAD